MGFVDVLVEGFWLTVGDVLWQFQSQREAYYAYRTQAFRAYQKPLLYHEFVKAKVLGKL